MFQKVGCNNNYYDLKAWYTLDQRAKNIIKITSQNTFVCTNIKFLLQKGTRKVSSHTRFSSFVHLLLAIKMSLDSATISLTIKTVNQSHFVCAASSCHYYNWSPVIIIVVAVVTLLIAHAVKLWSCRAAVVAVCCPRVGGVVTCAGHDNCITSQANIASGRACADIRVLGMRACDEAPKQLPGDGVVVEAELAHDVACCFYYCY